MEDNPFLKDVEDDNPFLQNVEEDNPFLKDVTPTQFSRNQKSGAPVVTGGISAAKDPNAIYIQDPSKLESKFFSEGQGPTKPPSTVWEDVKEGYRGISSRAYQGLTAVEKHLAKEWDKTNLPKLTGKSAKNWYKVADEAQRLTRKEKKLSDDKEQSILGEVISGGTQAGLMIPFYLSGIGAVLDVIGAGAETSQSLKDQGVDPFTAELTGGVASTAQAVGAALPLSAAGAPVKRAITGGALGLGTMYGGQKAQQAVLDYQMYPKQAAQMEPSAKDMAMSFGFGAAAGGLAGPKGKSTSTSKIKANVKTLDKDLTQIETKLSLDKEAEAKLKERSKKPGTQTEFDFSNPKKRPVWLRDENGKVVIDEKGNPIEVSPIDHTPQGDLFNGMPKEWNTDPVPPREDGQQGTLFDDISDPGDPQRDLFTGNTTGDSGLINTPKLPYDPSVSARPGTFSPHAMEMPGDVGQTERIQATSGQQTTGTPGWKGSKLGGVGKKQGGATNFLDGILNPDRNSPLGKVKTALNNRQKRKAEQAQKADALEVLSKTHLEAKIGSMAMDDPILAKKAAMIGKDISPMYRATNELRSGLRRVAANTNNPVLRFVFNQVNKAEQWYKQQVRKQITGERGSKDHLDYFWRKMNEADRVAVNEALHLGDNKQVDLTEDLLRKHGFNDAQVGFIKKVYEIDYDLYKLINEYRAKEGKEPMVRRLGHFPGIFDDSYSALVFKVDEKGNYTPFTMVGAEHPALLKHRLKEFSGKEYKIRELPAMAFKGMGMNTAMTGFQAMENMNNILKLIKSNNPDLALSIEDMIRSYKNMKDAHLMGFDKHELAKKGISGSAGNKAWRSDKQNAHDMYKAFTRYAEQGYKYHAYKNKALPESRKLLDDPEIDMPNAKREAQKYLDTAIGEMNETGRYLNGLAHIVTGGYLGISAKQKLAGLSAIKNYEAQKFMGFANMVFLGTQFGQLFTMHVPKAMKLAKLAGMSQLVDPVYYLGQAQKNNVLGFLEQTTDKRFKSLDAFDRQAIRELVERGMDTFSELERLSEASKNPILKAKDFAAEAVMRFGEMATRRTSFLANVQMLKEARRQGSIDWSDKQIFDVAEHYTADAMIDYNKTERPMLYQRQGVLGGLAGGLQTFKHGNIAFWKDMIKEGATKGDIIPLLTAVGTSMLLGGILGYPAIDELDEAYQWITGTIAEWNGEGYPRSLKEDIAASVPLWASMGKLSEESGYNLQSRFSASNMIPDSPLEATSPYLTDLYKTGKEVYEGAVVGKLKGQQDRNRVLEALLPSERKGLAKSRSKDNWVINNKTKQREFERTPEQWDKTRSLNLTPLNEAIARQKGKHQQMREDFADARLKEVREQLHSDLAQGTLTPEDLEKYAKTWEAYQQLASPAIKGQLKQLFEDAMGYENRKRGIPKSPSSVRKYLNYEQEQTQ